MPVDSQVLKSVVGSFPTGVTVVTAMGDDHVPRGLTSNAVCSVSANPPLVLVCVDKSSNTLPAFQSAKSFVVNFLAEGRDDISNRFASKDADKFAGVASRPSEIANGAPMLEADSIAIAECTTWKEVDAGDHWIFIGLVEGAWSTGGGPLMYFRRQYGAWPATS